MIRRAAGLISWHIYNDYYFEKGIYGLLAYHFYAHTEMLCIFASDIAGGALPASYVANAGYGYWPA